MTRHNEFPSHVLCVAKIDSCGWLHCHVVTDDTTTSKMLNVPIPKECDIFVQFEVEDFKEYLIDDDMELMVNDHEIMDLLDNGYAISAWIDEDIYDVSINR